MSPRTEFRLLIWAWMAVIAASLACSLQLFASDPQTQSTPSPPMQVQQTPEADHQAIAAPAPPPPPPLMSLTDGSPQELEHEGDVLRSQKRYLDSIDYYNAAIAKQATPLLWNKKGMSELFLQHNTEARKCFEQAVKLDKNSAEGLNNLGYMAQIEKRYNRAIKYYTQALEIRPNSATFHYNMGAAYFAKHQFDKATAEYRTAYQLDPEIFQRVSKMGIMVQTSSPEDRAAFAFMVAKMYAQAGDVDHSLVYLRKAMEDGYKNIDSVYKDAEFATLRTDPRFTELMARKPQAIQ